MKITSSPFGKTGDGQDISLFSLENSSGHRVKLINYGAIIVSVEVPDREGQLENVTLGCEELAGYLERHPYLGSTVGRFCNRIGQGRFTLDGKTYELVVNNGPNHLHGGTVGFDKLVWQAETFDSGSSGGVRFGLVSPDGQEGYPGNLTVTAEYAWNDASELSYRFHAISDAPTVLNLTNHAYWNLAGAGKGTIVDHEVTINCDQYLAVDDTLIPTGDIVDVYGTPLDLLSPHRIGERLDQLSATKGYDHCYVIKRELGEMKFCARATDPGSGRVMEVSTTQPGMQFYTGNHLSGRFEAHAGFCFETQHFPDSPNKPQFPTTRLNPGETFEETTIHRFSVDR